MKVLLDTNVVMDVLCHRQPHYEKSAEVMELCRIQLIEGIICSQSFATIAYVLGKQVDNEELYIKLNGLLRLCNISRVDSDVITSAIDAKRPDFEDAVQYYSAQTVNADCIISRDKTGFKGMSLPIFTPTEFMANCRR